MTLFQEHDKEIFLRFVPNHKDLWKEYVRMRDELRKSRNGFMHRAITAKLRMTDQVLAPNDPKKYPDWKAVHQVSTPQSIMATDFCEVGALAHQRINMVATTINKLWNALWHDSGTQLLQKQPGRQAERHERPQLLVDQRSFASTSSASGVTIVNTSSSLPRFGSD